MRAHTHAVASIFIVSMLGGALLGCGSGETARGDSGAVVDASPRSDARIVDARIDMVDGAETDASLDAGRTDSGDALDGGHACTVDAECDDADPCTTDRCGATGCGHAAIDGDADGFPAGEIGGLACLGGTDCDDGDPAVHPGASEICNGRDDNCDGLVDDVCECVPGAPGTCTTTCGMTGTRVCEVGYVWGECVPPSEVCNGVDDDCNGAVDETFACAPAEISSCTAVCGTTGSSVCSATCEWGACTPPAEICNALDDDCDGLPDNGFACVRDATTPCTTSCGGTGYRICVVGCSWSTCIAPTEICDGLDNDCNGARDDGFACVAGSTGTCTAACGSTGARTCDAAACTWGSCSPPAETCNGLDDDCDGLRDETFTCVRGTTGSCTSSCGTTGSRMCSSTCAWSACAPPTEVCNGADDDCDGLSDEGFTCRRGATRSCSTACGTWGTETCNGSCAWGACTPPAETCDGRDEDCDGTPDNGFACVAWSTRPCTTSCGTTGTQPCNNPTCTWGTCATPVDICNGIDDNCDGVVDNGTGCAPGLVCSSGACRSIPAACTGYRYAGHAYAICTTDATWVDASSTCSSYGGHLVTVTSAGEQSFLAGLIAGRSWSGLYRGSSCAWQWVTGEPVTYTDWDPGQPSSACGDQDCGDLWAGPSWTWDDYWCRRTAGYVCEWDA